LARVKKERRRERWRALLTGINSTGRKNEFHLGDEECKRERKGEVRYKRFIQDPGGKQRKGEKEISMRGGLGERCQTLGINFQMRGEGEEGLKKTKIIRSPRKYEKGEKKIKYMGNGNAGITYNR